MGQRFILKGWVRYKKYTTGNYGEQNLIEYFTAEDAEQAKVIARAMMESKKTKLIKSSASCIYKMEATLVDDTETKLWKIKFDPGETDMKNSAQTKVLSENFKEEAL